MLLVNGINVYPREIEEILYQFPGVKEAAVIGVPDARKGEQPLAFVAAHDGVQLEEVRCLDFARERLADYKVPRQVRLHASPPAQRHRQNPQNRTAQNRPQNPVAAPFCRKDAPPYLALQSKRCINGGLLRVDGCKPWPLHCGHCDRSA